MKRISLLTVVLLMVLTGVTKARFYCPVRYRTRWSPYAFGLISGDVKYSPYAFGRHHNGLVPGNVRYSPYAFGVGNSGLVVDPWHYATGNIYATCYRTCCPAVAAGCRVHHPHQTCTQKSYSVSKETSNTYKDRLIAQRQKIEQLRKLQKQVNLAKAKDGKEIIYRYLKSRNINDFKITGLLRIDNKIVSVNFLLEGKNVMISYRDLEQAQVLIQQPGHKRDYYEKNERQWRNLCDKYAQAGGKIYLITSANENEILAKLMLCSELNDG